MTTSREICAAALRGQSGLRTSAANIAKTVARALVVEGRDFILLVIEKDTSVYTVDARPHNLS